MKPHGLIVTIGILISVALMGAAVWWRHPAHAGPASAGPVPTGSAPGLVRVTKVIDGDTIAVALPEGERRVRLLGVNTPESVDPHQVIQCFGPEASQFAKTHVGGAVQLEADPTRSVDKYGRLLRYVYTSDGTLFNLRLIQEGYGQEYTYHGQSYAHQAEFRAAQEKAREEQKGFWSPSTCGGNIRQPEPSHFG